VGALGRIGAFIFGGLLGAGVGAAVAMLAAPQSGEELRGEIDRRVDRAKIAGLEAQARTEEDLIRRFRAEINDPTALRGQEAIARVETAQAIAELGRAQGVAPVPSSGVGSAHQPAP
jgi:gas vesicle protein